MRLSDIEADELRDPWLAGGRVAVGENTLLRPAEQLRQALPERGRRLRVEHVRRMHGCHVIAKAQGPRCHLPQHRNYDAEDWTLRWNSGGTRRNECRSQPSESRDAAASARPRRRRWLRRRDPHLEPHDARDDDIVPREDMVALETNSLNLEQSVFWAVRDQIAELIDSESPGGIDRSSTGRRSIRGAESPLRPTRLTRQGRIRMPRRERSR